MRIGIITFHFVWNYGAVLQCWALQTRLEKMGYEVEIINYCPDYHVKRYSIINKDFLSATYESTKRISSLLSNIKFPLRMVKQRKFEHILNYLNVTDIIKSKDEAEKILRKKYDAVICGSDQIWNEMITNGTFDEMYFADFTGYKGLKIAYAVSTGETVLENRKESLVRLTKGFTRISCREKNTAERLSAIVMRNIDVVPDPTFLLDKEDYISLIKSDNDRYIIVYKLEDNPILDQAVEFLTNRTGLPILNISPGKLRINKKHTWDRTAGPLEFLKYIANAEFIITNSFHGSVFSMLFEKKVMIIPHKSRNTRILNLLDLLEAKDLLVKNAESFNQWFDQEIDYDNIRSRFSDQKCKGIRFLEEALSQESEN